MRWTVIEDKYRSSQSGGTHIWFSLCKCACGTIKEVERRSLKRGDSLSCGCLRREALTTHGKSHSKTFRKWTQMRASCSNPASKSAKYYQGISHVARWNDFKNFLADMGEAPAEDSILLRKNSSKGFSKNNCIWADRAAQGRLRRNSINISYQSRTQPLKDWAVELGIRYETLFYRIRKMGWSPQKAFGTPLLRKRK